MVRDLKRNFNWQGAITLHAMPLITANDYFTTHFTPVKQRFR